MPQSLTRKAKVAILLTVALLLSACGAKVNTTLDITEDNSGTRAMNLTLKRDADAEGKINGGFEATDASIKNHLPDELTYSGLTVDTDQATASFTLSFTNADDYRAKAKKLP